MTDRYDDRYVDSTDSEALLRAWAHDTVDMGGWTGTDREAFREAIQDEHIYGAGEPLADDDLEIVEVDRTRELLDRLNSYDGDDIWGDIIYDYGSIIDFQRTDEDLDAEKYGDAIALRDGRIISYDRGSDRWTLDEVDR